MEKNEHQHHAQADANQNALPRNGERPLGNSKTLSDAFHIALHDHEVGRLAGCRFARGRQAQMPTSAAVSTGCVVHAVARRRQPAVR